MDKLLVEGGNKLKGKVSVSASKNATLPIMAAVLLFDSSVSLKDIPELRDVQTMVRLLKSLGVEVQVENSNYQFSGMKISSYTATYDLVKTMRASVLVLGPLLSRFGEAKVSLPGGCAIGTRPVDIHLDVLEQMGAEIKIEQGYIYAKAKKLKGCEVNLSFPSVGATENAMLAAVYAEGTTILKNAAQEPEIIDLANFLKASGVEISGEGTSMIQVKGVERTINHDVVYAPMKDRIEAGTFVIAGLITNSEIMVEGCRKKDLESFFSVLESMGATFEFGDFQTKVLSHQGLKATDVQTAPYPGYPTDLQAQMMSLMCLSKGASVMSENIFENRFMHVPELIRMGAKIKLKHNSAIITGIEKFKGAPVMCTDLRASAALVLAALASEGETQIQRVYHLDRGYEKIEQKLTKLGAKISRVKG